MTILFVVLFVGVVATVAVVAARMFYRKLAAKTQKVATDTVTELMTKMYPHPLIGCEVAYVAEPERRVGTVVKVDGSERARVYREDSGTFVRRQVDRLVVWQQAVM